MRLFATVLQMSIVIPPQPSAAVVLGAAMLGRFAADLSATRQGKPISTQQESEEAGKRDGGLLWDVMVEMTQPAVQVDPRTGQEGRREKKLLDAKYKVFREAVEVQQRWRRIIDEAVHE